MRAPRSRFRCGSGRSASADLCRGHPDSVGRRAVGYDCQALPATGGRCHGLWRSLVAHLTGGQGVAGSNPVSPTEVYAGQIPRGVTKPGFVQRRRGRGRDRLRVAVQPRGRATPLNWGNAKDGLVSRHRIAVRVTLWSHHLRYAAAALDEFVPAGPEAVSAAAASQRLWTGADRTLVFTSPRVGAWLRTVEALFTHRSRGLRANQERRVPEPADLEPRDARWAGRRLLGERLLWKRSGNTILRVRVGLCYGKNQRGRGRPVPGRESAASATAHRRWISGR